jgi:hypothetical protein
LSERTGVPAGSPPTHELSGVGAQQPGPGSDPLARTVFALLVLACLAAFLITQHVKHTPTVVQDFRLTPFFAPYPSGHLKQASISFKLEHAEAATVTIVDAAGDTVATLVRGQPVARYKIFSLVWNGRRGVARRARLTHTPHGLPVIVPINEGRLAAAGEYRVRVALSDHRAVFSPQSFMLVAGR